MRALRTKTNPKVKMLPRLALVLVTISYIAWGPTPATCSPKAVKTGPSTVLRNKYANRTDYGDDGHDDVDYDDYGDYESKYPPRDRLSSMLMQMYNSMVPPPPHVVTIEMGISLVDLVQLDYVNQILITSLRIHLRWKDERLAWNSSAFGGITRFSVPPHRIWRPTVLLHNSADEGFDGSFAVPATITNKGIVNYNAPGIFKSMCWMSTEDFPFDYQNCSFKFGLMHDEGIEKVELKFYLSESYTREVILRDYTRNNMWDIIGVQLSQNERMYTGISVPLQDLSFHLELRRKPLYYGWTLVFPITIVSYMIPLLLLIPIGSMERIVCTFLTCELGPIMMRNLVPWYIPNTSDNVTMMGKYGMLVSTMGLLIIIESVIQLWWVRNQNDRPPSQSAARNGPRSSNAKAQDADARHELTGPGPHGNVPCFLDKVLAGVFYGALTLFNVWMYLRLPYFYDGRSHMQ